MPRRRRRRSGGDIDPLTAIGVLLLIGGSSLAAWWRAQPPEGQLFLAAAAVVTIGSGVGLIILIQVHRRRRRALAWQRAMANWARQQRNGHTPAQYSALHLSPRDLERFAARVYEAMGYRVVHTGRTGDHGVDVKLIRPDGAIEVVQCKQWNKPVGERDVRDLFGAMHHERAAQGYIWAPRGFTAAVRRWARGKPLVLADKREIGRLVEIAFGR